MKNLLCLSISATLTISTNAIARDCSASKTERGEPELQSTEQFSSNMALTIIGSILFALFNRNSDVD